MIGSIESKAWLEIKDLLATNQSARPDFINCPNLEKDRDRDCTGAKEIVDAQLP
jgi:hypothetical protein